MPKFLINYSMNRNLEVMIEADDKEKAIELFDSGNFGNEMIVGETLLGLNNIMDVTHEYPPQDSKPKTKNPRKADSTD
jgi:hypothetical protein